jgi:hypothetical protein
VDRFRTLISVVLVSGTLAGLLLFAVQHFSIFPLIEKAEVYESAAEHSMPGAHDDDGWHPSSGTERTLYTALTTVLGAIGFAALLFGTVILKPTSLDWRKARFGGWRHSSASIWLPRWDCHRNHLESLSPTLVRSCFYSDDRNVLVLAGDCDWRWVRWVRSGVTTMKHEVYETLRIRLPQSTIAEMDAEIAADPRYMSSRSEFVYCAVSMLCIASSSAMDWTGFWKTKRPLTVRLRRAPKGTKSSQTLLQRSRKQLQRPAFSCSRVR